MYIRCHCFCSVIVQVRPVDWVAAEASLQVDRTVKEVAWATPGSAAGMAMLEEFCSKRLKNFDKHRNDPVINGLSNLSPWFHFGKVLQSNPSIYTCTCASCSDCHLQVANFYEIA